MFAISTLNLSVKQRSTFLDELYVYPIYICFPAATVVQKLFSFTQVLKCHCNEKIADLVLVVTDLEQHFQISLNGVFSFLISCFVSEIFRFLKHVN